MESLPRSLNYELPHDLLHYDQNAAPAAIKHIVTSSSTPTISTLDANAFNPTEFLQKLGATLIKSIETQVSYQQQQQHLHQQEQHPTATRLLSGSNKMDLDMAPNQVALTAGFDALDELQKQLEYDKLMNEVWIGIVFTLILISMVFCVCSCFLYHQFRTWKRNYHNTVAQAQSQDLEAACKLTADYDDPVPEYTLVSGLPSYESALELLQKTPKSCLIVYPSVYNVFTKNERSINNNNNNNNNCNNVNLNAANSEQQQQEAALDCTVPLLQPAAAVDKLMVAVPSYEEAMKFVKYATNQTQASNNNDAERQSQPTTPSATSPITCNKFPEKC